MDTIKKCSKAEAKILVKFNGIVLAGLDENLNPNGVYFTVSSEELVEQLEEQVHIRSTARGYVSQDCKIRLTKTAPRFKRPRSIISAVYIAMRDIIVQKKYGDKGKKRIDLENLIAAKLGMTRDQIQPAVSKLIYDYKAVESVE